MTTRNRFSMDQSMTRSNMPWHSVVMVVVLGHRFVRFVVRLVAAQ